MPRAVGGSSRAGICGHFEAIGAREREGAMKRALFALLSLSLPLSAGAAVPYCTPLATLLAGVKLCERNRLFVQAADSCLARLDSETKNVYGKGLAQRMAQQGAASASAQDAKVENNLADLTNAKAALQALLGKAQEGKAESEAYSRAFIWPGPVPDYKVKELDIAYLLERIPCYQRNQEALALRIANWEKKISELRVALGGTEGLMETDSASLRGLKGEGGGAASGAKAMPVPAVPRGREHRHQSDVTGESKHESLPSGKR